MFNIQLIFMKKNNYCMTAGIIWYPVEIT